MQLTGVVFVLSATITTNAVKYQTSRLSDFFDGDGVISNTFVCEQTHFIYQTPLVRYNQQFFGVVCQFKLAISAKTSYECHLYILLNLD